MVKMKKASLLLVSVALVFAVLISGVASPAFASSMKSNAKKGGGHAPDDSSLKFDDSAYTTETVKVGDQTVKYRAYENIVYVANPVDTNYQVMNFYVPESYYKKSSKNKQKGKDTSADKNVPIFFPNQIGGYSQAKPATIEKESVALALSRGYVVAAPGARGKQTVDENGVYTGKAPASIVDLKAAVRYLRHNDKAMPGDAEKIIANGTSAGGALTSLLGSTGNNKDYEPYLKAIGAADERDDIFAVSSYCPITNLNNADMAYEWQFNDITSYYWKGGGELTEEEQAVSDELKAMFPDYLNSLGLTEKTSKSKGRHQHKKDTRLTLNEDGEGSFKEYVKSYVIDSAQAALNDGADLSDLDWITIKGGKVKDIDFDDYLVYMKRMKSPPAFDSLNGDSFENQLFGTATIDSQHFTLYSFENSKAGKSLADPKIVKMMNPMEYIGAKRTTNAQHWRIRHGTIDSDTSLAVPVMLATALKNEGLDVDFELAWDVPHSGDYDLEEMFDWVDEITASKGSKKHK